MERELNRRKKLLADYGVGTLDLYRQASGQEEPAIVILLVYCTILQAKRDRGAGAVYTVSESLFRTLTIFPNLVSGVNQELG